MLTRHYQLFSFLLLLLLATLANATVVQGLYSGNVPVANQSTAEKSRATNLAFNDVIIKVTGNSQSMANPMLKKALTNANTFVQQYSYQANTNTSDKAHPFILQTDFDQKAINKVLAEANLPVWGQDRPLTLFWVAEDIDGKQTLLGANTNSEISTMIDNVSQQRGIPTIFPLLDLIDVNQVSVSDVMAPFVSVLTKASIRYGSNVIVIARLVHNKKGWSAFWTLVVNGQVNNWSVTADNEAALVSKGINAVADGLAPQFIVSKISGQTVLNLTVNGLLSLESFSKAKSYLMRLAPVKQVKVLQVRPDQAKFQVELSGSLQDFQQAIRLDRSMVAVIANDSSNPQSTKPEEDNSQPAITLSFRWLG